MRQPNRCAIGARTSGVSADPMPTLDSTTLFARACSAGGTAAAIVRPDVGYVGAAATPKKARSTQSSPTTTAGFVIGHLTEAASRVSAVQAPQTTVKICRADTRSASTPDGS